MTQQHKHRPNKFNRAVGQVVAGSIFTAITAIILAFTWKVVTWILGA